MGTGADVKDANGDPVFQHVHSIVTYSNDIDAIQLPGRGRKMKDADIIYIEYVNETYKKTWNQYLSREPALRQIAHGGKLFKV